MNGLKITIQQSKKFYQDSEAKKYSKIYFLDSETGEDIYIQALLREFTLKELLHGFYYTDNYIVGWTVEHFQ